METWICTKKQRGRKKKRSKQRRGKEKAETQEINNELSEEVAAKDRPERAQSVGISWEGSVGRGKQDMIVVFESVGHRKAEEKQNNEKDKVEQQVVNCRSKQRERDML